MFLTLQLDPEDSSNFGRMVELWFVFSLVWSVCCSVDEEGRKKLDNYIRELDGTIPNRDMVYEYFVDHKNRSWVHWDEKLKGGWVYDPL